MNFLTFQRRLGTAKHAIYTRLLRRSFGAMGKGCIVQATLRCSNPCDIYLGDRVFIGSDAWIDCFTEFAGQRFTPRLEVGDDTMIGYHSHIMVVGHLRIGRHVLIADKVYISDNLHGFEDITRPMMDQPLVHRPVAIEDEVWIGENACVMPGVTIGRHSVIGSNSVVTKDVPPCSVVAGVPARVLRQHDPTERRWVRVQQHQQQPSSPASAPGNGRVTHVERIVSESAVDLDRVGGAAAEHT